MTPRADRDAPVSPEIVRLVDEALAARHGARTWDGPGDPVGGLVGTILSQNTTGVNSREAFRRLREALPTWDDVANAPVKEVEQAIQTGGLARQKAPRIIEVLRQIREDQGRLSLALLNDMPVADAMRYLTSFRGVGPKTAGCVLMFDLGLHVFPVDTHVHRISRRLGWVPDKASAEKAQDLLEALIPGEAKYQLHINMVSHGRALCRPRIPGCDDCPIADFCHYPDVGH